MLSPFQFPLGHFNLNFNCILIYIFQYLCYN
nr:MAG TPA: hypothetical protein [Caudoviricetes sp.]